MSKKQTPTEKQPIMVTEGAEAPFLLYAGDNEKVHVRVLIHAETLWLPQRLMAELFQTTPDNIGLHLRNIYAEGELVEKATTEDFSVVQNEGGRAVRRILKHYSLDAIIAVGYRVSSKRATQFRIWATQILKEYIRKGFGSNRGRDHPQQGQSQRAACRPADLEKCSTRPRPGL